MALPIETFYPASPLSSKSGGSTSCGREAAVWGMSTTVGGKPHQGIGNPLDAVVNLPEEGTYAVSFFAHHGELDEIAPPGAPNDILLTPDFELQLPPEGSTVEVQYRYAGFDNPERYMPGFLPLAQGWRGYTAYNGLSETTTSRARPGLEDPREPVPSGLFDPFPTNDETLTAYSYASGDSSQLGPPPFMYPWSANPICVMYIDPNMGHTNFSGHRNRYFFAKDVWRFFRTHERRSRLPIFFPLGGIVP